MCVCVRPPSRGEDFEDRKVVLTLWELGGYGEPVETHGPYTVRESSSEKIIPNCKCLEMTPSSSQVL